MSAVSPERMAATQSVLNREALYLDTQRWDDWLALYAEDARFWLPAWTDEHTLAITGLRAVADLLRRARGSGGSRLAHPVRAVGGVDAAAANGPCGVELRVLGHRHGSGPRRSGRVELDVPCAQPQAPPRARAVRALRAPAARGAAGLAHRQQEDRPHERRHSDDARLLLRVTRPLPAQRRPARPTLPGPQDRWARFTFLTSRKNRPEFIWSAGPTS